MMITGLEAVLKLDDSRISNPDGSGGSEQRLDAAYQALRENILDADLHKLYLDRPALDNGTDPSSRRSRIPGISRGWNRFVLDSEQFLDRGTRSYNALLISVTRRNHENLQIH